jgi:hypothetical protein
MAGRTAIAAWWGPIKSNGVSKWRRKAETGGNSTKTAPRDISADLTFSIESTPWNSELAASCRASLHKCPRPSGGVQIS